jgi:hypothetical protein
MADDEATTETAPAPVEGITASASGQLDALEAEAAGTGDYITVRDQRFKLAAAIPAIVMLRMTAAGDSKTPPAKQMGAIVQFLHHAIDPEDRDEFEALLEDAEPVIEFEELNTILEQATEVIAARPTEQP